MQHAACQEADAVCQMQRARLDDDVSDDDDDDDDVDDFFFFLNPMDGVESRFNVKRSHAQIRRSVTYGRTTLVEASSAPQAQAIAPAGPRSSAPIEHYAA